MNSKKWIWITPFVVLLLGVSIWIGWILMTATNSTDATSTDTRPSVTQENDNLSNDVVNSPVSNSIVVFNRTDGPYENGHDFISRTHSFYNETLGWGRIDHASYSEQKQKAEGIIEIINDIQEVKNEELLEDFKNIKGLAEMVIKKDDRDAMRKLHRYFHDLDIYFNGYDYRETFQITSFKGIED